MRSLAWLILVGVMVGFTLGETFGYYRGTKSEQDFYRPLLHQSEEDMEQATNAINLCADALHKLNVETGRETK